MADNVTFGGLAVGPLFYASPSGTHGYRRPSRDNGPTVNNVNINYNRSGRIITGYRPYYNILICGTDVVDDNERHIFDRRRTRYVGFRLSSVRVAPSRWRRDRSSPLVGAEIPRRPPPRASGPVSALAVGAIPDRSDGRSRTILVRELPGSVYRFSDDRTDLRDSIFRPAV